MVEKRCGSRYEIDAVVVAASRQLAPQAEARVVAERSALKVILEAGSGPATPAIGGPMSGHFRPYPAISGHIYSDISGNEMYRERSVCVLSTEQAACKALAFLVPCTQHIITGAPFSPHTHIHAQVD
jgi:hypothetical protein